MKRWRNVGGALAATLICTVVSLAGPAVAQASITISDPVVTEGDVPTSMVFIVTRTNPLLPTNVSYTTSNGTAQAPGDYTATSGRLSFPLGIGKPQIERITVPITPDRTYELPETLTVTLSVSQEITKPIGIGTIIDDDPQFSPAPGRNTGFVDYNEQLISRAGNGGRPNGPVTDPTISGDARIARYVAYTSTATNIAPGSDGHRNVFLVARGAGAGALGTPWQYGSTGLVSSGLGGAAANGDSYLPALGGWTKGDTAKKPRCVAFISQASNLVAGDSNGHADAFVRKPGGGKLRRINAPASASEVAVSGDCRTIAVVAGGSLYVKRGSRKPRKLVRGGVTSPGLTYNGAQVGYGRRGKVLVRSIGGRRARGIANGRNPSIDTDSPQGKVRQVVYSRAGATYFKTLGGPEKLMSPGSAPVMSGGGSQAMFAYGPYAYLYAVSNSFGKKQAQGACPPGEGVITGVDLSSRGNYSVFSCTGGAAYLFFIGGK